jgi:prevent-host-death family protein
MTISEVQSAICDLVAEVGRTKGRVVIANEGVPVAALVSVSDLERLTRWERERAERWKAIEAIGAAFADVPLEELEAQLSQIATEGPQIEGEESQRKLA